MAASAYSRSERFSRPKIRDCRNCDRLLDPTAYDPVPPLVFKQNKHPFCSSTERNTQHVMKQVDVLYDVYNPTCGIHCPPSFRSKTARFPYEPYKPEDTDEILCRCGYENPCACPTAEDKEELKGICQAKVHKRLFRGRPPRLAEITAVNSTEDFETEENSVRRKDNDVRVPMYEIYRGWKWSKWTSPRLAKETQKDTPGPGYYDIEREKSAISKCLEERRHHLQKTSQLLRFMDSLQRRNIREKLPGPADYLPENLDCSVNIIGPKAERFIESKEKAPGPAEYSIKRTFDLPEPPTKLCLNHLSQLPPFGQSAPRFINRFHKSPGPADYENKFPTFKVLNCNENAPFLTSQKRWKPDIIEEDLIDDCIRPCEEEGVKPCENNTWQFKSRTKRFKSCEDLGNPEFKPPAQVHILNKASYQQYIAPFGSQEKRFQPWFNFIPNNKAMLESIGPAYYNLEKPKCRPAVFCGPLYRAPRFKENQYYTPPPNNYTIEPSTDTVLATHNAKLKANVEEKKKRESRYKLPEEPRILSNKERMAMICDKIIDILNCEVSDIDEWRKTEVNLPPRAPSMVLSNVKSTHGKGKVAAIGDIVKYSVEEERMKWKMREEAGRKHVTVTLSDEDIKNINFKNVKEESQQESQVITGIIHHLTKKPKLLRTFLYKHTQRQQLI